MFFLRSYIDNDTKPPSARCCFNVFFLLSRLNMLSFTNFFNILLHLIFCLRDAWIFETRDAYDSLRLTLSLDIVITDTSNAILCRPYIWLRIRTRHICTFCIDLMFLEFFTSHDYSYSDAYDYFNYIYLEYLLSKRRNGRVPAAVSYKKKLIDQKVKLAIHSVIARVRSLAHTCTHILFYYSCREILHIRVCR